jgi:trehalose 6-phosphate synthase/phosphatase
VLILSEMAGASKELFEAVLVNPFDRHAMADALLHAITMPLDEQKRRNAEMQKRIRRYSVEVWAQEFMQALQLHSHSKTDVNTPKIDVENQLKIVDAFQKAKRKAILLDYDGTLVPFHENPEAATPDQQLIELLQTLCKQPNTDLAIISGRDQSFMSHWLGDLTLTLVAEHGHYVKPKEKKWKGLTRGDKQWMSDIMPIFESFMDRTPGTFIEEKHNSLVWHYRKTDPELAAGRVVELKTVLSSLISDQLSVMDMDKALEVVDRQIDKGTAVAEIIGQNHYDFILCIGDDVTDENMFSALPDSAFTIKVGKKPTVASYSIEGVSQVKELLNALNITRLE